MPLQRAPAHLPKIRAIRDVTFSQRGGMDKQSLIRRTLSSHADLERLVGILKSEAFESRRHLRLFWNNRKYVSVR